MKSSPGPTFICSYWPLLSFLAKLPPSPRVLTTCRLLSSHKAVWCGDSHHFSLTAPAHLQVLPLLFWMPISLWFCLCPPFFLPVLSSLQIWASAKLWSPMEMLSWALNLPVCPLGSSSSRLWGPQAPYISNWINWSHPPPPLFILANGNTTKLYKAQAWEAYLIFLSATHPPLLLTMCLCLHYHFLRWGLCFLTYVIAPASQMIVLPV